MARQELAAAYSEAITLRDEIMPGAPEQIDYHPGVRVEVICRDDLVEQVVAAVEKFAHTGLKGDGKIYVTAIEEAVRISTGERGDAAV